MAETTRGWQPCKENIQPLPAKIPSLTLNEEPSNFPNVCDALHAGIQQQRQLFESQLQVSSGDEALDVWDRYITWSLQVSPDSQENSELKPLLERAVMQFAQTSYSNDPRYISLWIKLAENSSVPADMFRYMEDHELGRSLAAFYVAWAHHLERNGDLQQAERVLNKGLSCNAQPLGSIQQHLRSVQVRASGAGGMGEADSPPRRSQVNLQPRSRKRLAESAGSSMGLNLQLPSGVWQAQSLPLLGPGAVTQRNPQTSKSLTGNETPRHVQEGLEAVPPPSSDKGWSSEEGGMAQSANVRSMYCKELLIEGIEEFCFEELRAKRYAQAQRRSVEEKIQQMNDLEEKLKRELEEKQRMLSLLRSKPSHLDQVDDSSTDETRGLPEAKPFHIFTDPSSGSASSFAMPDGAGRPSPNPLCNDVFLRPGEKALCMRIQYPFPGGAVASENSHAVKGAGVKHLSLTEAVVAGVQNKTLCSSPDNTRDFAGSAHLVSTPCVRRALSSEAGNQGVVSENNGAAARHAQADVTPGIKLSPIQEASLETHTTDSTLGSRSNEDPCTPGTGEGSVLRDPCNAETRKRLLDQAEVSSFPGYHSMGTPLPEVDENTQLSLGSQVVFLHTKVQEEERFSVFEGLSQGKNVVLKVEKSLLPWDFYLVSQLRRRLSPEGSTPIPHTHCFLFLDGCVTLYTLPQPQKLSNCVELCQKRGVASVVCSLLLMMRTFHSSSLLLGALHTDSLPLTHGDSLLSVDLHSSLDLELQADLIAAFQVPAALGYIQQGVLKTSDSPYQVDLVCLAEAVHVLLTQRKMMVVKEEDGWMVEQPGPNDSRFARKSAWRKVFHLLLNSSRSSSVSILTQLWDLLVVMTPDGCHDSC